VAAAQKRNDRKPQNRPRSVQETVPIEMLPAVVRAPRAKLTHARNINSDLVLPRYLLRAIRDSSIATRFAVDLAVSDQAGQSLRPGS
jgi:hypothetical protein